MTLGESSNYVIALYSYSGMSVNAIEMAISPHIVDMVSSFDYSKLNDMTTDELLIFYQRW